MKLEEVNTEVLNAVRKKRKNVMKVVEEFWLSDMQAATVNFSEEEYKNVYSAQSSFSKAVKAMKVGVIVASKNGKLYLVKEKI